MKAKVNLLEDKPKRKFMNPKGKKFKKPNHFHSSPYTGSFSSFKSSQSSFFKPKTSGQNTDEKFFYVYERTLTWHLNSSTRRRNQSRLN